MIKNLKGCNALVTGAGGGLGGYICRALAAQGVNLAVADRPGTDLNALLKDLRASGVRAEPVFADLGSPAEAKTLVAKAEAALGPLDILVNNAGLEGGGPFERLDPENLERTVNVNLMAVVLLTRAALPGMLERGRGHVVTISSIAGKMAMAYAAPYSATKSGVAALMRALSAELDDGRVGFSSIFPGPIADVGMAADLLGSKKTWGPMRPPGQVGDAVVRAIREGRAEVIVSSTPTRLPALLHAVAPELAIRFMRGVPKKVTLRAVRAAGRLWASCRAEFETENLMRIPAPALLAAMVVSLAGCGSSSGGGISVADGRDTGISKDCAAAAAAAADFYLPPEPLPPGRPGDVLRCQESYTTLLSAVAKGTRIMYLSTDVHGAPIAVTGAVFEPLAPWSGPGERPLVGYTVGTHGQGDQCAPSRLLADVAHVDPLDPMLEYEATHMLDMLAQGWAIVVTDYQGLGTPGHHAWLSRAAEAHANIDAVRAARRLPGTGIPADGPLAFGGYSQGGNAAGATAELLSSYGPELHPVGIYVGAPPRDIPEQAQYIDGGLASGYMGYYLNGLAANYPEVEAVLDERLNDAGKTLLRDVAGQCLFGTSLAYGYRQDSSFTVSGESFSELLQSDELRDLVARDHLGNVAPSMPVLLATGSNDEVVPPAGVRQLFADWCARGATAELYDLPLPLIPIGSGAGHVANYPIAHAKARGWLQDRFAGVPAASTCP